jgi:basic amino acid/polyamine antiporter, APA family
VLDLMLNGGTPFPPWAAPARGRPSRFRFCWWPSPALFAALCYAELASMIPIAGSAYTYAYAILGEMSRGSSAGI